MPSSTEGELITFGALISKIQTLTDGGIRVMFDLSGDAIPQTVRLLESKRRGQTLDVVCTPRDYQYELPGAQIASKK